jgi:hypothetical protein
MSENEPVTGSKSGLPPSTYGAGVADAEKARAALRAHVEQWAGDDIFAWVDDDFAGEWWGYHVHCAWVQAWNATGRRKVDAAFLLGWLETPAFLDAWREAVAWETRDDASPLGLLRMPRTAA